MISIGGLVHLVIYLIVLGLIVWLLHWLVNYTNPPEPFKKVAIVAIVVVSVLMVIGLLLHVVGYPIIRM